LSFIFHQRSQTAETPHRLWFYICGFNIAILVQLFSGLFGKLVPRYAAAGLAILAIAAYTILVGGTASVVSWVEKK
jgi:hypothetical protein